MEEGWEVEEGEEEKMEEEEEKERVGEEGIEEDIFLRGDCRGSSGMNKLRVLVTESL